MKTKLWLALTGLTLPILAASGALAKQTAEVTGDRVNVRGQATLNSEVLLQLRKGEKIVVLEEITVEKPKEGEPAKWLRIQLPDDAGAWVFADFIDPATRTVTATRLNLRGGPGENFSVVGRLQRGDTIKEVRRDGDWILIEPPEHASGYLAAEYVSKPAVAKAAEPPPEPEPAPAPAPEPEPEPAPEIVAVPPAEEPAPPIAETRPAPAPSVAAPAPAPAISAPTEAQAPPRVVIREGVVRRDLSPRSPSYFTLESIDTGKTISYLRDEENLYPLREFVGSRVFVTGTEMLDSRWPRTPVILIQQIELP